MINPHSIPPFIGAFLSISLGFFVFFKNKQGLANIIFLLFTIAMFLWLFFESILYSINNETTAIIIAKCEYIGVTAIPILLFFLASVILKKKISNLSHILLSIWYLFSIYLIFKTNFIIFGVNNFFWGFYPKASTFHIYYLAIWLAIYIMATFILYEGIKNKKDIYTHEEKNKIKYMFLIFILGTIGICDFLPKYGIEIYPFGFLLIPTLCFIVTYAILKHQLMDINIVIRKGIAYSILITVFTIFYLLIIILTERSFQRILGYRSILISILFASIIALIFIPLKNRIQSFIDRIFLGKTPEQIAQENELLRQELLRSEKLKSVATFASGMAHEIKNPLTAIKTFTEYLSQKKDDKEFLEKFSKIVGSEVDKIDDLVHQLLDFSKPSPLQLKDTDIHKLLDDTLELLSSQFIKYRINVIRNFNADTRISNADKRRGNIEDLNLRELALDSRKSALNNISSACISKIDSNQMKQVFLNLFLNATEAMPSGGTLTVSTNLRSSDSKSLPDGKAGVLICVQDTGCGIPEKNLPHIFEPFYTTKEKGSGLGLSIVYNIIKEHGGKITVQSEVKQGTKFIIELPLS